MPPIIVHQSKEYSQDLNYNIPLDCIFHHTPSSYMDRYGWLKSMTQLSNVCSASPINNQILLFDGHDSHFDDCSLRQMMCKKIQPFVLKYGNSIDYQTNDNVPNAKLNSFYNVVKSVWMLKYGITKSSPYHLNSVLVEAWDDFKMSAGNIIRYSFAKTKLPHPHPSQLNNKYTGMCCLHPSIFWSQG